MKQYLWVMPFLALPFVVHAAPGMYFQGEVGTTVLTMDTADGALGDLFSSSAGFGGRISSGYLWNTRNWDYGIEGGVLFYPDITFTDSSVFQNDGKLDYNGYNIDLLGVLKYNFNSGFDVFAKAGAAYVHQTADFYIRPTPASSYIKLTEFSGNKVAPETVLGVGYHFTPNLEATIAGNVVFARTPDKNSSPTNVNPVTNNSSLLLGLTYRFGDSNMDNSEGLSISQPQPVATEGMPADISSEK